MPKVPEALRAILAPLDLPVLQDPWDPPDRLAQQDPKVHQGCWGLPDQLVLREKRAKLAQRVRKATLVRQVNQARLDPSDRRESLGQLGRIAPPAIIRGKFIIWGQTCWTIPETSRIGSSALRTDPMTLFIPDISHHQAGISVQALVGQGCAALIARVGQGAGVTRAGKSYGLTRDREWQRHRDEARRVGLPLVAYWYVGNRMTANEQAAQAATWCGDDSIPWMIDHEDASGDISFYRAVVAAFQAQGLRVIWGYLPKWYYDAIGGGSLKPGPPIVNSRYSTANGNPSQIYFAAKGDQGNGWIDFGGQTTELWQFTNKARLAGMEIDCSAFRGTYEQLIDRINGEDGSDMPTPNDLWSAPVWHHYPDTPEGRAMAELFGNAPGDLVEEHKAGEWLTAMAVRTSELRNELEEIKTKLSEILTALTGQPS